jgi:aminoglycoside phosphotransferase (APT) family kinase protein
MVRRGLAALLDQSQIAHYLVSLGLVNPRAVIEEDLTITDASRRNAVFLATSSRGRTYVVKQAGPSGPATLAREAAVLRELADVPALAGVVPELAHYDEPAARLVLRSPAEAIDWGTQRRVPQLASRALGRALAAVHGARVNVEPLAPGDERLWGLSLVEPPLARVRSLSAGALALLAQVQADARLCDRLRRLRTEVSADGFVHGDLRRENCLVSPAPGSRRRTRVLLIDWEHAGPGPSELDVGAALAEYLRVWVDSCENLEPDSDFARLDLGARRPLALVQPPMEALWTAYRRAATQPVSVMRVAELAGARLLEAAFEYAQGLSFVSGHAIVLLQIAKGMLQAPGFAAWNLLRVRE